MPTTATTDGMYVVIADYGDSVEVREDEVYNDRAYAWQMADELQAEADEAEDAIVYRVYALTEAAR